MKVVEKEMLSCRSLGFSKEPWRLFSQICMCGDYFRKKRHGRELFVGVRLPQVFQHNSELQSRMKRATNAAQYLLFYMNVKIIIDHL